MGRRNNGNGEHILRIETSTPIGPSFPVGIVALGVGLLFALHTPAWLIVLQYKPEDDGGGGVEDDDKASGGAVLMTKRVMDAPLFLILDLTPKVASSCLCIFLSGLFLYLGVSKMVSRER